MNTVHLLDDYYLLITLLITVFYQLFFFSIAFSLKFDKLTAIYMIAVSPAASGDVKGQAYKALYATMIGPIFLTTLLMFVSGINLAERPSAKRRYENDQNWEEYAHYLHQTSILIPFPPILYARLPLFLKRTLFLEFPLYVFDPAKHSDGFG
ncbi:oxidoreductase-like protein, partial [Erysiphe pulchra]